MALIIIAVILLLIILLLNLYVGAQLVYEDELRVYVRVCGVKIQLYPKKPPKQRISKKELQKLQTKLRRKKPKTAKKAVDKPQKEKKKKDTAATAKEMLNILMPFIKGFMGKAKFIIKKLDITVSTDDAASTALMYTAVCDTLNILIDMLRAKEEWDVRFGHMECRCDYTAGSSSFDTDIMIKIKIWQALVLMLKTVMKSLHLIQPEGK